MKAVGYRAHLPVADAQSLLDLDLPVPEKGLKVEVTEEDLKLKK